MADRHLRQRALAHRGLRAVPASAADAPFGLWLESPRVQLCLRGDGGRAFARAVSDVLGVAPPAEPNTTATEGARTLLWLGPDEWLVVAPETGSRSLHADLEAALDGQHALVSDVGHSRVILALRGAPATDVLRKGCSLDLDPVAFGPGRCAQAPLARAHMLLHQVDATPLYHVYVHRSFADYAFAWLTDAGREYGLVPGEAPAG